MSLHLNRIFIAFVMVGRATILVMTVFLAECSVAPDSEVAILHQDVEGLRTFDSDRLCEVYEDSRKPLIRQELIRRGAVRPDYWGDIDAGAVRIGMTQTEMLCATWPVAIHTTSVAGMTSIQWS